MQMIQMKVFFFFFKQLIKMNHLSESTHSNESDFPF